MKGFLKKLYGGAFLSESESRLALLLISEGKASDAEIASFLTVYLMRPITVEELTGFRNLLMEIVLPLPIEGPAMDLCGTGGDAKNTFNVSTLSALVIAACGVRVVKHGNYGVSSLSGSSNVLEYLGYSFTNNSDSLQKEMEANGICFLHAPLFHPALGKVAHIRKSLGVKTFFNMLGPLVNPAQPSHRMTGVYSLELARMYHYLLQKEKDTYLVVHDFGGYDEISGLSDVKVFSREGEGFIPRNILNMSVKEEQELYSGDSVASAAKIFVDVLQNRGTRAQREITLVNSAYALGVYNNKPISECLEIAKEVLESGKPYSLLNKIIHKN